MYEKLQILLDKTDKTAYQVSKETGVSTATLSNWKNGNYVPKADKLKKNCRLLRRNRGLFSGKSKEGCDGNSGCPVYCWNCFNNGIPDKQISQRKSSYYIPLRNRCITSYPKMSSSKIKRTMHM